MKLDRYIAFLKTLVSSLLQLIPRIGRPEIHPRRIIVIGAGMAGMAAAQRLQSAGHHVIILEARDRMGGRVHTDYNMAAHPVELGAEYIHGDGVVTWGLLKTAGLNSVSPVFDDDQNLAVYADGRLHLYPSTVDLPGWALLEQLEDDNEQPHDDLPLNVWLGGEVPRWVNHAVAPDYGADVDQLGTAGYFEATYAGDGDGDFRILAGYGRLVEAMAKGLDIRLNTPVEKISYTANDVRITTRQEVFQADAVVITLPLGVLKAGTVVFDPPLPDDKRKAIAGLGAAKVNKIILKFDAPFWESSVEAIATELDTQLWWRAGWGQANEAPVLTALIGGRSGEKISAMTEKEALQLALNNLNQMFNRNDLSEHLVAGCFVNWGADPYSQMGYSYVPVGAAGLRALLAKPLGRSVYFAGEATSITHPATVHGAIMSGWRVAQELTG